MGIQVDREAHERAMAALDARVSGQTSHEEGSGLMAVLMDIPPFCQQSQELLVAPAAPGSLQEWARATPLAKHAFDYSSMALSAANDALTTMATLVLKGQSIPYLGLYTLSRQVAENAITAAWCLETNDPELLVTRGLAAAWRDTSDKRLFAVAAKIDPLIAECDKTRRRLIDEGRVLQLVVRDGNHFRPRHGMPKYTDMFSNPPFPNAPSLEFYYRMISGAAHGRGWAQINLSKTREVLEHVVWDSEGKLKPSGAVVIASDPNVSGIGDALALAFTLQRAAAMRFDERSSAPAPNASAKRAKSGRTSTPQGRRR